MSSIADVAEVAVEFRERGLSMRVATKSPRLTERYLLSHGINYFSLVRLSGTLELAPEMGFADELIGASLKNPTNSFAITMPFYF